MSALRNNDPTSTQLFATKDYAGRAAMVRAMFKG
jgi:hypothetical protein